MKGVFILTEGRSGSTWLGSLTNATGVLGRSGEWLDEHRLPDADAATLSAAEYADRVIARGASENDFFSVKIFPRHLFWFQRRYGVDFIAHAMGLHDVRLMRLTRRDRVRQAISFARAMQSKQWTSRRDTPQAEPVYDFERIARCYFLIRRSYAFWDSYALLRGIEAPEFVYEDMLASPEPYVRAVADHAGLADLPPVETDLKIQRDAVSDAWRARFLEEAATADLVPLAAGSRAKARTVSNLGRFLSGQEMKPYAYSY